MGSWIDVLVGAGLGLGFVALARRVGGPERVWLALGLVVAALVHPLLGLTVHAPAALPVELGGVVLFAILAVLGAAGSAAWLVLGWALHAFFDLLLPWVADTAYVPAWYASACLGFDLAVAAAVAARALAGRPDPATAHAAG